MFTSLVTSMGEEVFWPKFLQALNEEDAEKIMNMSDEHLKLGYNPEDIKETIDFINKLPWKYYDNFFNEIMTQLEHKEM